MPAAAIGTKERLSKDAVRRELAAEAAEALVRKALGAKEAMVAQARANAAFALSVIEDRKKKEEEKHLMELALARDALEDAKKQSELRIQAAEASLLKAKEEGHARLQAAEKRNLDAIQMAKAACVESITLSQQRIEDAKCRTAQVEELVQRQIADAEQRQARQLQEAEERAVHIEKEAEERAEIAKQVAADLMEKQVQEMQHWVSQTEDDMLRTQERLEAERAKAYKLAGNVYAMAANFQLRGQLCEQGAEEMLAATSEEVSEMIQDHRQWQAEEMEYVACQADGLQGLEDLVRRLRQDPMLEDA